jgi:hypothetical protein
MKKRSKLADAILKGHQVEPEPEPKQQKPAKKGGGAR